MIARAYEREFMERKDDIARFSWLGKFIISLFLRLESQKHDMLLQSLPSTKVLLDGGCGWGLHSEGFKDKTSWLIGLDIAKKHLIAYRERLDNNDVSCILASLDYLPFRPDSFDGCVLQDSLEHTKNPLNVLHQIKPVITPNGIVVATVPNWYNSFLDANPFSAKAHHHFYSSLGWKRLFKKAGFHNCDVSCVAFPILNRPFLAKHFHLLGICVVLKALKTEGTSE